MHHLLTAILEDDRKAVKALLQADSALATGLIAKPKLYNAKIFHWIYAGDTALHLAAAGYRVEILRLLLAAGADPNAAANHRRSTPLHYAADGFITGPAWDAKRQVGAIRSLLQQGADIHAQDRNGATPLHRAVRTRSAAALSAQREIIQAFLSAGVSADLRDGRGKTVRDWARSGWIRDVLR